MNLSLLQLWGETPCHQVCMCLDARMTVCALVPIRTSAVRLPYFRMPFSSIKYLYDGRKSYAVNICASESSFVSSPSSNRFIAAFGYTIVQHSSRKVQTLCSFAAMTPYSLDPAIQLLKQQQEKECSAVMDNSHVETQSKLTTTSCSL